MPQKSLTNLRKNKIIITIKSEFILSHYEFQKGENKLLIIRNKPKN